MIKSANNPQAMVNQLIQNNPNYSKIQEIGKQYNGDYQKAFYEEAKKMGIDPNEFLNGLK